MQLFVVSYLCIVALFILAFIIYWIELGHNNHITTVAEAVWFMLVTGTTVGYGDIVPQTTAGKIVTGIFMVLLVGLFSLPAGVMGASLALKVDEQEANRNNRYLRNNAAMLIQDAWRIYWIREKLNKKTPDQHLIIQLISDNDPFRTTRNSAFNYSQQHFINAAMLQFIYLLKFYRTKRRFKLSKYLSDNISFYETYTSDVMMLNDAVRNIELKVSRVESTVEVDSSVIDHIHQIVSGETVMLIADMIVEQLKDNLKTWKGGKGGGCSHRKTLRLGKKKRLRRMKRKVPKADSKETNAKEVEANVEQTSAEPEDSNQVTPKELITLETPEIPETPPPRRFSRKPSIASLALSRSMLRDSQEMSLHRRRQERIRQQQLEQHSSTASTSSSSNAPPYSLIEQRQRLSTGQSLSHASSIQSQTRRANLDQLTPTQRRDIELYPNSQPISLMSQLSRLEQQNRERDQQPRSIPPSSRSTSVSNLISIDGSEPREPRPPPPATPPRRSDGSDSEATVRTVGGVRF